MATTEQLYRVWWDSGRWTLKSATDTDAVYRSFKPRKRQSITRVDIVRKTSEVLAPREEG